MRHRKRGRHLGRSSSHRKALLKNLTCSLFLTERDEDHYEGLFQSDGKTAVKPPAHKGRIVTTLHKAKEVRPFVEHCISIACRALPHQEKAAEFEAPGARNSDEWQGWRKSENYTKWLAAIAPAVTARRRVFALLRDKDAVRILFDEIAPRFAKRSGGYTRILRLANVRLGDAGQQAILELVGKHDRVKLKSQKPTFEVADNATQQQSKTAATDSDTVIDDQEDQDVISTGGTDQIVETEDAADSKSEKQ